jgi:hypothetical protein
VRGAKGADFENVKKWYNLVYPCTSHLIRLINTEKKDYLSYGTLSVAIASKGEEVK